MESSASRGPACHCFTGHWYADAVQKPVKSSILVNMACTSGKKHALLNDLVAPDLSLEGPVDALKQKVFDCWFRAAVL